MSIDEFKEYPSYNALDRTAMFMGVPLLPAVMLLMVALLIFLVGGNTFGVAGFMFGFVVFPVFLFLRQISQTDDRALYVLYLEMIFKLKRVAFREFGNTLTMTPERYLRHEEVILQNFRAFDSRTK
jgi:virB3-like protein